MIEIIRKLVARNLITKLRPGDHTLENEYIAASQLFKLPIEFLIGISVIESNLKEGNDEFGITAAKLSSFTANSKESFLKSFDKTRKLDFQRLKGRSLEEFMSNGFVNPKNSSDRVFRGTIILSTYHFHVRPNLLKNLNLDDVFFTKREFLKNEYETTVAIFNENPDGVEEWFKSPSDNNNTRKYIEKLRILFKNSG